MKGFDVRHRFAVAILRTVTALVCVLSATPVFASTVGPQSGCDFKKIQDAINAHPAFSIIYISPGEYDEVIDLDNTVTFLIGNDPQGCGFRSDGAVTINGVGHNRSVVNVSGTSTVALKNLIIINGAGDSGNHGGGLDFAGNGLLDITNVTFQQNHSGYGGGFSASGNGGRLEVALHSGTAIQGNRALTDGGGIHIDGDTHLSIIDPGITIFRNDADRNGGGIDITGPAFADIGSPGTDAFPVIEGNHARNDGGGISALAHDNDDENARVTLFTTDPRRPVTLDDNRADNVGGAVYLQPFNSLTNTHALAELCALEFRIVNNFAKEGAAIYADQNLDGFGLETFPSQVHLNGGCAVPPGAVLCAAGVPCDEISGNRSEDSTGAATSGSTILLKGSAQVQWNRVRVHHNQGGHVVRMLSDGGPADRIVQVNESLFADNTVTGELFFQSNSDDNSNELNLNDVTVAHNTIGGSAVFALDRKSHLTPSRVIIAENPLTVSGPIANVTAKYVLASDITTLPADPTVFSGDPRFVNVAGADYHLLPSSPAVDAATALTDPNVPSVDLDFNTRGIALLRPDTPYDLGAYELQALMASRLVFTQSPATVVQGAALGTVVVTAQDPSGNVVPVSGTVDFTIAACGTVFDLGRATMTNGVAALTSAQRFYTPTSGLALVARYGSLSTTSGAFPVVANSGLLFSNGFESCRL